MFNMINRYMNTTSTLFGTTRCETAKLAMLVVAGAVTGPVLMEAAKLRLIYGMHNDIQNDINAYDRRIKSENDQKYQMMHDEIELTFNRLCGQGCNFERRFHFFGPMDDQLIIDSYEWPYVFEGGDDERITISCIENKVRVKTTTFDAYALGYGEKTSRSPDHVQGRNGGWYHASLADFPEIQQKKDELCAEFDRLRQEEKLDDQLAQAKSRIRIKQLEGEIDALETELEGLKNGSIEPKKEDRDQNIYITFP